MNKRGTRLRFTASASLDHSTHYQATIIGHAIDVFQPAQASRGTTGNTVEDHPVGGGCVVCGECFVQPNGTVTCKDCHPIPCPKEKSA